MQHHETASDRARVSAEVHSHTPLRRPPEITEPDDPNHLSPDPDGNPIASAAPAASFKSLYRKRTDAGAPAAPDAWFHRRASDTALKLLITDIETNGRWRRAI